MNSDNIIALHGRAMSVVLERREQAAPLWRYWGPRLADEFVAGLPLLETRETPSFSLDQTVPFTLFPTFGLGWFGQSALLAHRAGADFTQDFGRIDYEWQQRGSAILITLHDDVAKISVAVSLKLDADCDVLTLSSRLINNSDALLDVQWLAAAVLPLPDGATQVRSFSGRHNGEFLAQCEPLGRAIWRKENRHGLTSHDAFPGAVVDSEGCSYGAQLAWSGNHAQSIDWLDDGRFQWQFGVWLAPGEMQLAPGASMTTPDVLATCAAQAHNAIAQNFHAAMRKRLIWSGGQMKPRPVHLNTWEGYYFDHDLPSLLRLADVAAEVGIERFVLDDGWFHRRDDDKRGLGDWFADARKYPDGLAPLAQHVISKGMEFGLWVEPEMVNPDSDLFRAHPDWAMQTNGRPLLTARNQLVLDLTQKQVGDYLFDAIAGVLRDLPVSYLKWDHNRDLVTGSNSAKYVAQVQAAYALFDRFRAAFPHIEIEACAGGGGRIDAGILAYTHRFWTSDCIDAVSRAAMQPGFLQYMPPEMMGAHIGTAPAHSTGRSQSLDFRAAIAMQGHLGIEFDLVKLADADRARLAQWIDFYKQWRSLLHGQVWTGKASDGMIWHAADAASEWLLFVYRLEPMSYRHMPTLRLPFVERDAAYDVVRIGPDESGNAIPFDGSWLQQAGLSLPHMKAESAIIFHGKKR
jgi:alpha-galactosidase